MDFLLIASILCTQNSIGNLCFAITPDQINPQGVDLQIFDQSKMEYLTTMWTDQNTMISKIFSKEGCYEWKNEEINTSTCQ